MNKYEIMFIVRPNLEENDLKGIVKSFEEVLTKNGAKIESSKDMGQKELAYEINKYKNGYYFYFLIEEENAEAINEFDRLALINENIIRHLVVRIDE